MMSEHTQTIDLEEQIERCHRLADGLADASMRIALEELAEHYEAQLEECRRGRDGAADNDTHDEGFMLQQRNERDCR